MSISPPSTQLPGSSEALAFLTTATKEPAQTRSTFDKKSMSAARDDRPERMRSAHGTSWGLAISRPADRDQALDDGALRAIRLGLAGKLRKNLHLPESFIERYADDLVGQGLAEYTRARAQGQKIENPGGWVVNTAFRRAIDQLRREGHEVHGAGAEMALEVAVDPAVSTEANAIEHVEVAELHEAISTLSASQRQALSLYYFEEKSTRSAADALGVSEPTFRRRRDSAIRVLRERFGIPEFQPGDRLAAEVGFAAWLSLATAHPTPSGVDRVAATVNSARHGVRGLADRVREGAVRLFSSGGGEGIGGAASGPVAKVVGVCATTAVAACAATGVIGPGIGGIDVGGQGGPVNAPAREHIAAPAVPPAAPAAHSKSKAPPATATAPGRSRSHSERHGSASATAAAIHHRAEQKASSQFGVESEAGQAASESSSAAPAPTESAATPAPEAEAAPSPTRSANEQFGLP